MDEELKRQIERSMAWRAKAEDEAEEVRRIAERTKDAFSYSDYADGHWLMCADHMHAHGLELDDIELVLRSKWMRWAAERSSLSKATVGDFQAMWPKIFMDVRMGGLR